MRPVAVADLGGFRWPGLADGTVSCCISVFQRTTSEHDCSGRFPFLVAASEQDEDSSTQVFWLEWPALVSVATVLHNKQEQAHSQEPKLVQLPAGADQNFSETFQGHSKEILTAV